MLIKLVLIVGVVVLTANAKRYTGPVRMGISVNPDVECPGAHEEYIECLLGYCGAKTCAEKGISLPCPGIAAPCAGGCICQENYLRNNDEQCIAEDQCSN